MSNLLLGWPIYSDASTVYAPALSGGSWLAALPLANSQDRRLAKVARSTNAALTSTIIDYDLGVSRSVRLHGIPVHNFSTAAKWRCRAWAALPFLEDRDFSSGSWSSVGTPVVTHAQADPLGGTRATLVEDDDGAAVEYIRRVISFTGDGSKAICIVAKQGTATVSDITIVDDTAGPVRHRVRLTWTAGVPAATTQSGAGTIYTPVSLGGGWYAILFTVDSVVGANTNRFRLNGASGSAGGSTGSTYYYELLAWDTAAQQVLSDVVADAWPSGLAVEDADRINVGALNILSAAVSHRYGRIELADTANTDGYLELGRLAICGGVQPTINMSYGAKLGWLDRNSVEETDGGAVVVTNKRDRRILTFDLDNMATSEALTTFFEMQRREGTRGQFYTVFDPADTTHLYRRSFLGRFRELNPLDHPHYDRNRIPVAIAEEL